MLRLTCPKFYVKLKMDGKFRFDMPIDWHTSIMLKNKNKIKKSKRILTRIYFLIYIKKIITSQIMFIKTPQQST